MPTNLWSKSCSQSSSRRAFRVAVACLSCPGLALGGPIDPPAGPIQPTMKTLDEVEPRVALNQDNTPGDTDSVFRITQPGSYYLAQNLEVSGYVDFELGLVHRTGIEIDASDVTLDLNGFTITGADTSLDGVRVEDAGHTGITIRNGHIVGMGASGVSIPATTDQVDLTTDDGLSMIADLNVRGCARLGVWAPNAQVWRSTAEENIEGGILARSIFECVALNNRGGVVTAVGLEASVIKDGHAEGNSIGFRTLRDGLMEDCVSVGNTSHGIWANERTSLNKCTARSNGGFGFYALHSSAIEDCSARYNERDGFYLLGSAMRIERNISLGNETGYFASGENNLFIANLAIDNPTNYNVAAGNLCQVVAIGATASVSGNSGGTSRTTNPFANFGD